MNAIWESLLLRGTDPEQLTLDFGATTTSETADAVLTQWIDAAEREKASRSRFRQAALRPDEVAQPPSTRSAAPWAAQPTPNDSPATR